MGCHLLNEFLLDCYLPCKQVLQNHIDSQDIVTNQKGNGAGGEEKKKGLQKLFAKVETGERLKIALKNLRGALNRKGVCYLPCLHGIG